MGRRTIFIGDVHSCLDELHHLVEKLAINKSDRVIMLGDLINRGPFPAAVVRYVVESEFECLMGNHEQDYLDGCHNEEKYIKLRKELGPRLHAWVAQRPLYIEADDFLAVHAGLEPGKHPRETKPRFLLNIRTWDGTGADIKNPLHPPWYNFYSGEKPVFYGHWATAGLTVRKNTIGLDSGCVYGKALSAYILEEKRVVQVEAARVYYVPPSLRTNPPMVRT